MLDKLKELALQVNDSISLFWFSVTIVSKILQW